MAEWHPRQNVYRVEWWCRNGRHAEPYAVIQQRDIRREDKTWGVEFIVRAWAAGPGQRVGGPFATGDEAAVFAWEWHLGVDRERHDAAARREHERPARVTANTPDRTERD